MDQPSPAPKARPIPPSPNGERPVDPDALPPSTVRRAQLLLMLIVLPVVAVSLPAIFVTMIFGQHPRPKTPPAKPAKLIVAPARPVQPIVPAAEPVQPAVPPAGNWFSSLTRHLFPSPKPPKVRNTAGLQEALQHSATSLLPTPSTLTGEPVKLTCRPERLTARAERVVKQAEAFGGTANEWLAMEGEKHFYVELPAGRADAFRRSLTGDAPAGESSPSDPPAASPSTTAAKDQVEVFIHANSDE